MLKQMRITIVLIVSLISVWLYFLFSPAITESRGIIYYLSPGTSKSTLVTELSQQGVLHGPRQWLILLLPQKMLRLKTGEYFFPYHASLFTILRQIVTGRGLYYRAFTIIPGWSFAQLKRELALTNYLKHDSEHLDDKQIMMVVGNEMLAPEGEFFPETYRYTRGVSDLVILKQAFLLMQQHLNAAWASRVSGLPFQSPYEALIAASLIEKEAYLNAERPIIAGVLINRLRSNMLLQFDPTVIYGMGARYTGKIHKENLLEDNAYNTYVHKGLPPTPIAMPAEASIEAATHPQVNDYYYFVAKGDGSGQHQFSKTLLEHNAAVQQAIGKAVL